MRQYKGELIISYALCGSEIDRYTLHGDNKKRLQKALQELSGDVEYKYSTWINCDYLIKRISQ